MPRPEGAHEVEKEAGGAGGSHFCWRASEQGWTTRTDEVGQRHGRSWTGKGPHLLEKFDGGALLLRNTGARMTRKSPWPYPT